MKNRQIFLCYVFIFICAPIGISIPPTFDSPSCEYIVSDPKTNLYSYEIEERLVKNGYTKIPYEEFSSTSLYKKAHLDIYNEEYCSILPNKIDYYIMNDGLYYCMLSDQNYEEDPPILTYLILEKDGIKFVFYKINYQLTYELVEKEFYDPMQNWELNTQLVKVFF